MLSLKKIFQIKNIVNWIFFIFDFKFLFIRKEGKFKNIVEKFKRLSFSKFSWILKLKRKKEEKKNNNKEMS